MASDVFVDTGFWYEVFHGGLSPLARRAQEAATARLAALIDQRRRPVVTNLIIAETHQLLLLRDDRRVARSFLAAVYGSATEIVTSTPSVEAAAVTDWLDRFRDQPFSLCDAVSFAVMRERGIRQVLAFDRHFAAAGFEVLPG